MFKNNLNKSILIVSFFILGFLIIAFLSKKTDKENEKKPSFYDTEINSFVNENLEVGYLFKIGNKTNKPGTYQYEIEAKQNDERIIFLTGENSYNEDSIVFNWRQTEPPYQIIKKAKADTLYIIKNGRKIAFPKYSDKK